MLSLPPSTPPPPSPPPPATLAPLKPSRQITPTPLHQIVLSKQAFHATPNKQELTTRLSRREQILYRHRRTNPIVWFSGILCLIFSLLLIFFGITTLIVFLVIKPRSPLFDIPSASLNTIYFDSPEYFNGDYTFIANFSNPNGKIDVRFEYIDIELYFSNMLIATQALQPFTQRRGEVRVTSIHLISSLVYLPPDAALELRQQVQSNRVKYNIRGTFKVQAILGQIHFSYWLHSRCQLEMTDPPFGVLVSRTCSTKR
ncbi:Late embryogenesis abundant protein, LEA_2 subgroup [Dillenia turbinata]|uniref:Late embryogenesis abundant protein, LEA_2 subgroup n=1 Tax=Dillenia turbinata TaxID=194707 RepID=A0AAN8VIE4_9MAGN